MALERSDSQALQCSDAILLSSQPAQHGAASHHMPSMPWPTRATRLHTHLPIVMRSILLPCSASGSCWEPPSRWACSAASPSRPPTSWQVCLKPRAHSNAGRLACLDAVWLAAAVLLAQRRSCLPKLCRQTDRKIVPPPGGALRQQERDCPGAGLFRLRTTGTGSAAGPANRAGAYTAPAGVHGFSSLHGWLGAFVMLAGLPAALSPSLFLQTVGRAISGSKSDGLLVSTHVTSLPDPAVRVDCARHSGRPVGHRQPAAAALEANRSACQQAGGAITGLAWNAWK